MQLSERQWTSLLRYDKWLSGEDRSVFLRPFFTKVEGGVAFAAFNETGNVIGYGEIREGS